MNKLPQSIYTSEFKAQAALQAKAQGTSVAARALGLRPRTLGNWVRAEAAGKPIAQTGSPVTPEAMELARLMRLHGIRARHKRRFKVTTDSAHAQPIAPNRLARQFKPEAPNRVWTSDITFIATQEGWLYLAVVIDLFNRQILGWSMKTRMTADIVTEALRMAYTRRKPETSAVVPQRSWQPIRQPRGTRRA